MYTSLTFARGGCHVTGSRSRAALRREGYMKRRNFLTSLLSLPFGIGAAAVLMKPSNQVIEVDVVPSKYFEPVTLNSFDRYQIESADGFKYPCEITRFGKGWTDIHPGRIVWDPRLKMNVVERPVGWPT